MWIEGKVHSYLAIFFVILVTGFIVHQSQTFPGSFLGHGIGVVGSLFMLMTLIYPFRKRVLKKKGDPIIHHVSVGLLGSTLVIVHSGHKASSLIGLLLYLTVVLMVLSGITGYYLYKRVNRSLRAQKRERNLLEKRLKSRKRELIDACRIDAADGMADRTFMGGPSLTETNKECSRWVDQVRALAEREQAMQFFDRLKAVFSKWIQIHYTLTIFLFSLMIIHVLTTLYYGLRWIP